MNPQPQIEIAPHHRDRLAVVYFRWTTPPQVPQSTNLCNLYQEQVARAWGWPEQGIRVIEDDAGSSGSTAKGRPGFQRLCRLIKAGQVGLVLVSHIVRLSRLSKELLAFLRLCQRTDTLLAVDGILVDRPTDHFMEGLWANITELENALRRERLMQAARAKARSGSAIHQPPTGFVADRAGRWRIDPDRKVRATITRLFTDFARLGSVGKVVAYYRERGIRLPVRTTDLAYREPSPRRIRRILSHPAFKGTYIFGRRVTVQGQAGHQANTNQTIVVRRHHDLYITPARWNRIQARLRRNPRSGK